MRTTQRRNTRRLYPLAGALVVACAAVVSAQVATQTAAATNSATTRLGELYAQVAQINPKIGAAQALVRAAQARIPGAKRPRDPQIQLGFMNYALPGMTPMAPLGMTQLQIMQMVPLGGKLGLAGRVAEAQADATSARAEGTAWELRSQTAMGFYDLYATDQQLAVARETLLLLHDISRTADAMYRVGEGRQADVLRANVEIAKMAEDTLRMHAVRATTVFRLNVLLDRGADEQIATVARPLFPDSMPDRALLDSVGVANRPMIRAAIQDVRAADASASLARKEVIPDLQVGVQYSRGSATMIDPEGMTSRKTENMGSLMIGASIPLFARDRQYQMRSEANAMKAMAEADVNAMRAETRGKIGEAYADLTRAREIARLYRTTLLPQAEATVSSALSSYRVGTVDFMTLLDDQMTVNKYRQELFELEADEGKAWAELEMLTGRELIDSRSVAGAARSTAAVKGGDR